MDIAEIKKALERYRLSADYDEGYFEIGSIRKLLAEIEKLEKERDAYQNAMSQWIITGYQINRDLLQFQNETLLKVARAAEKFHTKYAEINCNETTELQETLAEAKEKGVVVDETAPTFQKEMKLLLKQTRLETWNRAIEIVKEHQIAEGSFHCDGIDIIQALEAEKEAKTI